MGTGCVSVFGRQRQTVILNNGVAAVALERGLLEIDDKAIY